MFTSLGITIAFIFWGKCAWALVAFAFAFAYRSLFVFYMQYANSFHCSLFFFFFALL
jgi:hypothetical protein